MAAFEHAARSGDHGIGALTSCKRRILDDSVEGNFGRAPEYGEHRAVLQELDRIVAPFAGGDHTPVKMQDSVELAPLESDPAWRLGAAAASAAARERYRIEIAQWRLPVDNFFLGNDRAASGSPQPLKIQGPTVAGATRGK